METAPTAPIEGLLNTGEVIAPPEAARRWFPIADQDAYVADALRDPIAFWRERARRIEWQTAPREVFRGSIDDQHWFADGRLNATVSCLDRHARRHPDAIAYHYLCENGTERTIAYAELLAQVSRLANALRLDGVRAGDRVCIYMPLTIEGIVAMLACARIGAIHSVVYAGLGATALRDRIVDAGAEVLLIGDVTYRKGRAVDLKRIVDDAVRGLDLVRRIVVHRREATPAPEDRARSLPRAVLRRAAVRVRAGDRRRRASAVHPVHERDDGQAEGRRDDARRIPRRRERDADRDDRDRRRTTSTGARATSGGSSGIRSWCTARSPTAIAACCAKARPTIREPTRSTRRSSGSA